ncbi:type II secretion system GspH family protein [Clostridium bowmanii]|uniref:type IV pilus modification PilV family protein n=1 Tax=Clostridium bowmanii TaxID=132925 RepID=UPI001C0B6A71|nr:type II secretion system protein [Clostridium bowmanii]MBU3189518.1 type II secretion system GspH family protein [Clostridium bowmanii]MCA1074133.1 type II secretion system GspH family protein [Clostridium bowmanii]
MKFIKSKKGLTLIEIIVSIAILSIIIGPILSLTLNSVKMNKKSDEKMQALSLAQKEMEGIKSPKYIIVGYTQVGNVLTKNRTEGSYEITETLIKPSESQVVDEFSIIKDADADIVMKFDYSNIGIYDKSVGIIIKDLGTVDSNSIVKIKSDDSSLDLGLDGVYNFPLDARINPEINIKIYLSKDKLKMDILNFSSKYKLKLHFIKQDDSSQFEFNQYIGNAEYYSIDPSDLSNSTGPIYRLYEVKVEIRKMGTTEILQELKGYKKIS